MSIRDDFKPYIDGNNLLAPNPVSLGTLKGSDNGPMFTSEYFIMLKKQGLLQGSDIADFEARINSCINQQDMLCRVPVGQDDGQEQVDDYYGVTNGCMELGITAIPRKFLWALLRYYGCLNNESPGSFQWDAFLARQLQLVCAVINSSFPSLKNPAHYLVRIAAFPLYVISAFIILFSSMGDIGDTDSRRLAWHLGNNLSKTSLLCWLAYKVWKSKLYSDYPDGMNGVAAIYYQPKGDNPYEKWWVT